MADLEKKIMPEGPAKSPDRAKVETVESRPTAPEALRPAEERIFEQVPVVQSPPTTPLKGREAEPLKDELTEEIEEVLSEDLGDLYKQLPLERQQKFKQEGEKTAGLIRQMIWHGQFHGRRILNLIIRWLKLIPGVNRFFLEQESKIKTDKLQILAEEHKKDSSRL